MTQQAEKPKTQGFYVTATFDRLFDKERKNQDGTYTKTHYVGLLVRSDDGTGLCEVRTKNPEKYTTLTRDQVITLRIFPRAFKDNIYYSDEQ